MNSDCSQPVFGAFLNDTARLKGRSRVCLPSSVLSCPLCLHLFMCVCVYTAADFGVDVNLCEKEVTVDSSGEYLTPCRHGPGSCLRILVEFLSETHNSLVKEARRVRGHEERSVLHRLNRVAAVYNV